MVPLLLIEIGVVFAGGFQPGPPRHQEQPPRDRHFLPEAHGPETLDLERVQRLKFHFVHLCQPTPLRKAFFVRDSAFNQDKHG